MFLPFDIEAGAEQCAELDRQRERLAVEETAVPLRWRGRLRRELEASAVAASETIEGVVVTVEDVVRVLAGDPPPELGDEKRQLVEGYHDAMRYCANRARSPGFEWSTELVAGLHDRVMAGAASASAGRIRAPGEAVSIVSGSTVVFRPPAEGVAAHVGSACERVAELEAEGTHPALVSAWVHVAIAAVHPFRDGNGRLARVLASLAMMRGGFDDPEFCSLEEWWGRHTDAYYSAFDCLGPAFDPGADVTPFIRAHLDAHVSHLRSVELRERTQRALWQLLERVCVDLGLLERGAFALWDAFGGRITTNALYRELADVGTATARNDLMALVAAGLLTATGATRGRRYAAADRLYPAAAARLGVDSSQARDATRASVVARLAERVGGDEI